MYNSIYPVNINYTKNQYRKSGNTNDTQNTQEKSSNQNSNTFPNGTKVAIDYTKGQINISQVLTDFRSTIVAINAPDDVKEEVSIYLNLVDKESKKESPSREIILSNLKNASKVSDSFIATSLKKPSNVVEGWIDALFLQKINLKADPNEVNPDFLLEFPTNAKQRIENQKTSQTETRDQNTSQANLQTQENAIQENTIPSNEIKFSNDEIAQIEHRENTYQNTDEQATQSDSEPVEIENNIELSSSYSIIKPQSPSPYSAASATDERAKDVLVQIKSLPSTNEGDTEALNLINEALGLIEQSDEGSNENIKAALHFERGKIFDGYDYVDYALRDYWEATKASELNLKAQAFYKSGMIYDEFNEFDPALDGYLSSVAYSGEADNVNAQTIVLSKIASLYAKQFNLDKSQEYSALAEDNANQTNNYKLIAQTYSTAAQNQQYLGENEKAIESYRDALLNYSKQDESYMDMALNYEQAADVMRKLGNSAKADKLQSKAQIYYQKAQLEENQQAIAS